MTITVVCPSCRSKYSLKDEFAGTEVACFGCQEKLQIPALTSASDSPERRSHSHFEHISGKPAESINYFAAPATIEEGSTCPECNEVIAQDLETCPHCQADLLNRKETERGKMPKVLRLLGSLDILAAVMSPFAVVAVVSDKSQTPLLMLAGTASMLMSGVLNGAIGVGYFKGYRWAWWYTIGASIDSFFTVLRYFSSGTFFGEELPPEMTQEAAYVSYVVMIMVGILYLIYFRRTKVMRYFRIRNVTATKLALAAIIVGLGSYLLLEMPKDLIQYSESRSLIFQGASE